MLETITFAVLQAILVSGLLGYYFLKREAYFKAQFDNKKRALEESAI